MKRYILAALVLLLVGEGLARWAIDIKLYEADGEVGYWTAPGQSGGALLTGDYVFNEQGFGVAEPLDLSGPRDVVLVGDSLVFGTKELSQPQLLGPTLQRQSDWTVWPLATGSWSLHNALRALDRQDLSGAEAVVFVVNSGDVTSPSQWRSRYDLPREEPLSYLVYAIQKAFPPLRFPQRPIPVREGDLEREWQAFQPEVPVLVVGYDWAATTGTDCSWMPDFIDAPVTCFDPIGLGLEGEMLDGLHLDANGNASLARVIDEALKEVMEAESGVAADAASSSNAS